MRVLEKIGELSRHSFCPDCGGRVEVREKKFKRNRLYVRYKCRNCGGEFASLGGQDGPRTTLLPVEDFGKEWTEEE